MQMYWLYIQTCAKGNISSTPFLKQVEITCLTAYRSLSPLTEFHWLKAKISAGHNRCPYAL